MISLCPFYIQHYLFYEATLKVISLIVVYCKTFHTLLFVNLVTALIPQFKICHLYSNRPDFNIQFLVKIYSP